MSGAIPIWSGEHKLGEGVKLGVFSQDLAQVGAQELATLLVWDQVLAQQYPTS
jgi:hypothetical protein